MPHRIREIVIAPIEIIHTDCLLKRSRIGFGTQLYYYGHQAFH